jgi:hypothetical protein
MKKAVAKNSCVFVSFVLVFVSISMCLTASASHAGQGLKADAAMRKITPAGQTRLAGNGRDRVTSEVHDDLFAHCLYITDGAKEASLISLDLLGLSNGDVQTLRKQLKSRGLDPAGVFVASTHTHTGPDTIGFWGPEETVSGRGPAYTKQLYAAIGECAAAARDAAKPAEMGLASGTIEGVCVNTRNKEMQDNTANVMQFREPGGPAIATVVNYGCHPEIMLDSKVVSSDFLSVLYRRIEEKTGGATLFFNGALGGMVTPIVTGYNWPEAERVGNLFSDEIEMIMQNFEWSRPATFSLDTKKIQLSCANQRFIQAVFIKLITRQMAGGKFVSEMMHMRIGPAEFFSMPGEALPKVALRMKELFTGKYKFLVSLGDDELGYILAKEDFDPARYEESVSIGPDAADELYAAAKSMTADGGEASCH